MANTYQTEKIDTSPEDRRLVERFMEFPELDLPQYITWNDIMPVVHRIEAFGYKFQICRRRVEIEKDGEHHPHPWILSKEESKLRSTWEAILLFVRKIKK